jgi:hypothetical protein
MSRRKVPPPAKLVVSVIYRDEARFASALAGLAERFGPVESTSPPFPFDRTDYYEKEMGTGLVRRFVVLHGTVRRDVLADAKIEAEFLERASAEGDRRTVNIDPGLLAEENFVLATGKSYNHRVYLRDGVFADLTLVYRKGEYRALPWTYPDDASDEIRSYFAGVRCCLKETIRRSEERSACG